jgi:hypothetical protein
MMDLDAIRTAIRPAVLSDDMAEACHIMERAADLPEGSLVAGRFEQMSAKLALTWELFREIEDRAESLRHWLIVERLWPNIKIGKETPPTTADRRRPGHTAPSQTSPVLAGPVLARPYQTTPSLTAPCLAQTEPGPRRHGTSDQHGDSEAPA